MLFPPLREAIGIEQTNTRQFDRARQLFGDAIAAQGPSAIVPRASELGFYVKEQSQSWQGMMISEEKGACEGRGAYLFRYPAANLPLAITAPHRGADQHTGTIAASLFLEGSASAAAWNSAPRHPRQECPHALDLAREPRHAFTAFAVAFAEAHPDGAIVQIHGFERMKRPPGAAREADIILSNGTRKPDTRLLDLADCLSLEMMPHRALVFPNETAELGALGNAQAMALGDMGFDGFVHLELSAELRAKLVKDEALLARFRGCLEKAAQ
jgi:hypothetical protein